MQNFLLFRLISIWVFCWLSRPPTRNLSYWWQLNWAWLSTSVCKIPFCPFMIVPIFCHLNVKSKLSSMWIEVIQLTHCWSRDCSPIASTWFLATFCERYLFLVLFQCHCSWFIVFVNGSLFLCFSAELGMRFKFESGS